MGISLSDLVNNLSEGIKCKFGHNAKKCKTCGIRYKYCDCFLAYINFQDDLVEYKCFCCNKNYQHLFDEKLTIFNTYRFSNHDTNKIILLL